MFWRIYPLAIILGLAAGSGLAILVSLLGLLVFSAGDADAYYAEHTGYQIIILASSTFSSFAAGWVTARFALGEELLNACATGILLLAFGFAGYLKPPVEPVPGWLNVLSFSLVLPLSVIGSLLYRGRSSAA